MKKTNFLNFILLMFILAVSNFSCFSCMQKETSENKIDINENKTENEDLILAAHKCNTIEKLKAAVQYGIDSYEIDIHLDIIDGIPKLMIGHEIETATGQSFEDYIKELSLLKPNFKFLWLDFKDFNNDEMEHLARKALLRLDEAYSIKTRVLIEGSYPEHLAWFADNNWHVTLFPNWYSLPEMTKVEQKDMCESWMQAMNKYKINGISYGVEVYDIMQENFVGKKVNNKPIKQYAWNHYKSYSDPNIKEIIKKYKNLSVLLIVFP